MRAHKSYLCTHPSWMRPNQDPLCPRCKEANETFSHAILHCPTKSAMIEESLPTVMDIMQIWKLQPLLLQLAKFIHVLCTGFLVKDLPAVSLLY